jgi:hypothetical protein
MEVTDNKTLPKDERKRKQIETAPKKSREAKLIKLADKTSNLRAIASSPAADWSVKRRLEYIEWAKNVVAVECEPGAGKGAQGIEPNALIGGILPPALLLRSKTNACSYPTF